MGVIDKYYRRRLLAKVVPKRKYNHKMSTQWIKQPLVTNRNRLRRIK